MMNDKMYTSISSSISSLGKDVGLMEILKFSLSWLWRTMNSPFTIPSFKNQNRLNYDASHHALNSFFVCMLRRLTLCFSPGKIDRWTWIVPGSSLPPLFPLLVGISDGNCGGNVMPCFIKYVTYVIINGLIHARKLMPGISPWTALLLLRLHV